MKEQSNANIFLRKSGWVVPGRNWLGGERRLRGLREGWKAHLAQGQVQQECRVYAGTQLRAGTCILLIPVICVMASESEKLQRSFCGFFVGFFFSHLRKALSLGKLLISWEAVPGKPLHFFWSLFLYLREKNNDSITAACMCSCWNFLR